MDVNQDANNIDNINKNKTKEYDDGTNKISKNKNIIKKTKKKGKITKKIENEQSNLNNNENQEEEKKIDIIIQDNKSNKKETIEDILNKQSTKKKLPPIINEKSNNDNELENINKEDNFIDNSVSNPNMNINKYLRVQIDEKMKKIEDLSLSQDTNKKTLTEILQKLNTTIKSNAELLYSGEKNDNENENKKDKENRLKELNFILESKKKELNISKEINKSFKNKYENMVKDYTTPSTTKIDIFQKKIDTIKINNSLLNKKIHLLNYKNHLKGKKLELSAKIKDNNEIKIYSDEYTRLVKEKYNQFVKLNNNKKLIKDAIEQFQYLIKIINGEEKKENENEKNSETNTINVLKDKKIEEDINNLKVDLSGNEENIYNRIVTDKTIMLEKYYKKENRPKSIIKNNKSLKKIKIVIPALSKNLNEENKNKNKNKKLFNSKSCNDITVQDKKNINEINNNNNNNDDINFNEINYDNLSNVDYEKIKDKRQKYYNLGEKLDKSIKELSLFYEHKIKDINEVLDINSKKLSNIQQENELLKSKITDLRRILELNIKEQRLLKQNLRYRNIHLNENNIDKNNNIDINKEKFEISDIGKNNDLKIKDTKKDYIDMLKDKYKVKKKVILQEDITIHTNEFESY